MTEYLAESYDAALREIAQLKQNVKDARARIQTLEAALRPFADEASKYPLTEAASISMDDLWRARRALDGENT